MYYSYGVCDSPSSVGSENKEKKKNEIDELPNPRPTQPTKRKNGETWHLGHFFPTANNFFVDWDLFYVVGNSLPETQPNQILGRTIDEI